MVKPRPGETPFKIALHRAALTACLSLPLYSQTEYPRALAQTLERDIAAGQTNLAQQALQQLLAQPHVELEVLLETGAKLAERELFEPARSVFLRGVHDYPESFEARYNLALADIAIRNFQEGKKALEDAAPRSEEQHLAREYLRGKIYDALEQPEAAERSYTAAWHGAPHQENYALDLGLFYLRRHLSAKAMDTLAAGVKYHPDSVYMELGLALAQVLGDDPPRAVATCRNIVAKDPAFSVARLLLATALYMNGEYQNCLTETEAAVRQPGVPPYLQYLQAASLLKSGSKDYSTMLRDLDAANSGIARCVFCYFTKSKVHEQMEEDTAAIVDLETLVTRVDPEFAQGWYRLANLYQHVGRRDEATKALDRFRALRSVQTDREAEYLRQTFLDALK
jgi:predicted Zn-dependent protease